VTGRSDFKNGMIGPKRRENNDRTEEELGDNCKAKLKRGLKDFHRRSSIKLPLFKKDHNM